MGTGVFLGAFYLSRLRRHTTVCCPRIFGYCPLNCSGILDVPGDVDDNDADTSCG